MKSIGEWASPIVLLLAVGVNFQQLHEWAPIINGILLLIAIAGIIHLFLRSKGWTLPIQDSKIRLINDRLIAATRVAESAQSATYNLRRDMEDSTTSVIAEIRTIGRRVEDLHGIRTVLEELDHRTVELDQNHETLAALVATLTAQVSTLACSESAWHPPDGKMVCPLHRVQCPLHVSASVSPGGEEQ